MHIMAFRQERFVGEIVTRSGVLGERVPWHPGSQNQGTDKQLIGGTAAAAMENNQ